MRPCISADALHASVALLMGRWGDGTGGASCDGKSHQHSHLAHCPPTTPTKKKKKKNMHFALEKLQKSALHDVAFQNRLETGLGLVLKAKLGLSLSQVGPCKGSKWHVKVT